MRINKKREIQKHHITYEDKETNTPERVVSIYRGEHGVLTRLQWWCSKGCSKGFIEALEQYISDNKDNSIELADD
jgi:hypothetical protein